MRMFGVLLAAAMLVTGVVSPPAAPCTAGGARQPSCGCAPSSPCGSAVGRSCCCRGSDPRPVLPAPVALTPAAPSHGVVAVVPKVTGDLAGAAGERLALATTSRRVGGPARFLLSCAFLC